MTSPSVYDTDDCDKHQQNDWDGICLMKGTPHYSTSAQIITMYRRTTPWLSGKISVWPKKDIFR